MSPAKTENILLRICFIIIFLEWAKQLTLVLLAAPYPFRVRLTP